MINSICKTAITAFTYSDGSVQLRTVISGNASNGVVAISATEVISDGYVTVNTGFSGTRPTKQEILDGAEVLESGNIKDRKGIGSPELFIRDKSTI